MAAGVPGPNLVPAPGLVGVGCAPAAGTATTLRKFGLLLDKPSFGKSHLVGDIRGCFSLNGVQSQREGRDNAEKGQRIQGTPSSPLLEVVIFEI